MNKVFKKSSVILLTLANCILLSVLCSFEDFGPKLFFLNLFGSFMLFFSNTFSRAIFLLTWDYLCYLDKTFRERLGYVVKSLLVSNYVVVPLSVLLLFLKAFGLVGQETSIKILTFVLGYICPVLLFLTFKLFSKRDWQESLKAVSLGILFMIFNDLTTNLM